jgi:hypothetical protein
MIDSDEIWIGIVNIDGKITDKPLLYFKNVLGKFHPHNYVLEWDFLHQTHQIHPGLFFKNDCVYFCSYRREDVCSFISGLKASYCMTFRKMKSFFGSNSGEYSANSSIHYESLMKPEKIKDDEDDEDEEFIPF